MVTASQCHRAILALKSQQLVMGHIVGNFGTIVHRVKRALEFQVDVNATWIA